MWELGQSGRNVTMMWIPSHDSVIWYMGDHQLHAIVFQLQRELCFRTGSESETWEIYSLDNPCSHFKAMIYSLEGEKKRCHNDFADNVRALWSESTLETVLGNCRRWYVCLKTRRPSITLFGNVRASHFIEISYIVS
jgi:hypothetical protein